MAGGLMLPEYIYAERRRLMGSKPTTFPYFTYVAGVGANSSNAKSVTTGNVNTTTANLLVIQYGGFGGFPTTITDNIGVHSNTYTLAYSYGTTTPTCAIYICINPSFVGSGHNATVSSASAIFPSINFAAFNCSSATLMALESSNNGAFASSSAASITPGSMTPSVNGELILCAYGGNLNGSSSSPTINNSFTITSQNPFVGSNSVASGLAYLNVNSVSPVTATWSNVATNWSYWATQILGIKP